MTCAIISHQGYELEKKETPGLVVDLNSTLKQQNTLDFVLVGKYSTHSFLFVQQSRIIPFNIYVVC